MRAIDAVSGAAQLVALQGLSRLLSFAISTLAFAAVDPGTLGGAAALSASQEAALFFSREPLRRASIRGCACAVFGRQRGIWGPRREIGVQMPMLYSVAGLWKYGPRERLRADFLRLSRGQTAPVGRAGAVLWIVVSLGAFRYMLGGTNLPLVSLVAICVELAAEPAAASARARGVFQAVARAEGAGQLARAGVIYGGLAVLQRTAHDTFMAAALARAVVLGLVYVGRDAAARLSG